MRIALHCNSTIKCLFFQQKTPDLVAKGLFWKEEAENHVPLIMDDVFPFSRNIKSQLMTNAKWPEEKR